MKVNRYLTMQCSYNCITSEIEEKEDNGWIFHSFAYDSTICAYTVLFCHEINEERDE